MVQSDLPAVRQLVVNGALTISDHAYNQMLRRNILYDDVEDILSSSTNQIVECQSPSHDPNRSHTDERVLICDPFYPKDIIVIIVALLIPSPEIRVITAEYIDNSIWIKQPGQIPAIVRK